MVPQVYGACAVVFAVLLAEKKREILSIAVDQGLLGGECRCGEREQVFMCRL
jgi:hypothetical protein